MKLAWRGVLLLLCLNGIGKVGMVCMHGIGIGLGQGRGQSLGRRTGFSMTYYEEWGVFCRGCGYLHKTILRIHMSGGATRARKYQISRFFLDYV